MRRPNVVTSSMFDSSGDWRLVYCTTSLGNQLMAYRNSFLDFMTWTVATSALLVLGYAFATRSDSGDHRIDSDGGQPTVHEHVYSDCVVTKVLDGDSMIVAKGDDTIEVRLAGIDCPEFGQRFGNEAREMTSKLCLNQRVSIKRIDTDRYGRTIAIVATDSVDVAVELLRHGMAWQFKAFDTSAELSQLEETARNAKLGLWADANPIAPWEFRETKRQLESRGDQ
ncbi:MAG: thermonuclease family protein [Planctomycetales bacterium]|nr:thermonuclease family protein [Planctomycetales bacterium]